MSNEMQYKAVYLLFCKFTLHVSGVNHTHHQEHTKLYYSLRYWSCFLCSCLPPMWPSLATLEGGSCTVPEAVVTVLCSPDEGSG